MNFYPPDINDYEQLISSIKGIHGLTLFGGAFITVQILFFALRGPLGSLLGIHRLLVLSILSVLVTIGTKLISGDSLLTVLTDAPTLLSFQVCLHQFIRQWSKRESDRSELDPDSFNSDYHDSHSEVFNSETQN